MRIIAGRFRGKRLSFSASKFIRPTKDRIRESMFNIIEHAIGKKIYQSRVLDLFAGTGALGIEALSRGAKMVLFIENSVKACNILRNNITVFDIRKTSCVLRCDATRLGKIAKQAPFDFVFADPPYGKGLGEKAFLSALFNGFLHEKTLLILEETVKKYDNSSVLPSPFVLKDKRCFTTTKLCIYSLS